MPRLRKGRRTHLGSSHDAWSPAVNSHLDLIRNDYDKDQQAPVARIYLEPGTSGLIVKDVAGEHYEGNIRDTLGEHVLGPAEQILLVLQQSFHGPYLVASDVHSDADCPFRDHSVLPIERRPVAGGFELPSLKG